MRVGSREDTYTSDHALLSLDGHENRSRIGALPDVFATIDERIRDGKFYSSASRAFDRRRCFLHYMDDLVGNVYASDGGEVVPSMPQ